MPVYENETYEQGVFRVTYPDVAAALEAGFGNPSARATWLADRTLPPVMAEIVREDMDRDAARFSGDPAQAWDCRNIPNGRYVVQNGSYDEGGEEFDFSIHLVQNGSLAGKRVVRYKFPEQRTYKAFAWLTRGGELSVWRAFRNDERIQAAYIVAARKLLVAIQGAGREAVIETSTRGSWFFGIPRGSAGRGFTVAQFRITPQVRCFHCSGLLDIPAQVAVQHCESHMPPPRVDPLERERLYAQEREARLAAGRDRQIAQERAAEARQRAEEEELLRELANQPVPAVPGRRTPLPICEVTRSEVQ